MPEINESFMLRALELADEAASWGDVPVGCVIVNDQTIIGEGCNRRERDQDPCAHAEVVALRQAALHRGHWRLDGCTLYVTLEPCSMCAGAIVNARIEQVVFGCRDPKAGAVRSMYQIADDVRLNHRAGVVEGVLAEACARRLTDFFAALRRAGKK